MRISIAQRDGNGITAIEALKIANGVPIKDVISDEKRLGIFMQKLNDKLRSLSLPQIPAEGSLKGRLLDNNELHESTMRLWRYSGPIDESRFPLWSGTLVAHTKPGERIGNSIECEFKREVLADGIDHKTPIGQYMWNTETVNTFVFDGIPSEAIGQKDILLAVNHGFQPDGTPIIIPHEEGKRVIFEITDKSAIGIVPDFVRKGMPCVGTPWYNSDEKFGIPVGDALFGRPKNWSDADYPSPLRCFSRSDEYVGFVVRADGVLYVFPYAPYVNIGAAPDRQLGVDIDVDAQQIRRF